MSDNQTRPVDAAKPPLLFDKVIATINSSPKIQDLLYDLDLLPEQTADNPRNWSRTGSIALEIAEREEKIRQLQSECAVLIGILRDCDSVIATIEADDTSETEAISDLRMKIEYATHPYRHKGELL